VLLGIDNSIIYKDLHVAKNHAIKRLWSKWQRSLFWGVKGNQFALSAHTTLTA